MLGLDTEEAGWTKDDGTKEELATSLKELLLEKADMLKEYFSIVVDKKGNLKSLPILLGEHILVNYLYSKHKSEFIFLSFSRKIFSTRGWSSSIYVTAGY